MRGLDSTNLERVRALPDASCLDSRCRMRRPEDASSPLRKGLSLRLAFAGGSHCVSLPIDHRTFSDGRLGRRAPVQRVSNADRPPDVRDGRSDRRTPVGSASQMPKAQRTERRVSRLARSREVKRSDGSPALCRVRASSRSSDCGRRRAAGAAIYRPPMDGTGLVWEERKES